MKYILLLAFLLVESPLALALNPPAEKFRQESLIIETSGGARNFTIEVADTPAQQQYGLMNRKELPRDHGMLFIFPRDVIIQMWMKDTLMSLDMLFIDEHGRVVYIASKTIPNSTDKISAGQPVRAVLELKGGTVAADGIKPGDMVKSPYFKP